MSKTTIRLDNLPDGPAGRPGTDPMTGGRAGPVTRYADLRALIRAADPRDLSGELNGERLRLTWTWPNSQDIQLCVVVWRKETWPEGPEDGSGHVVRVSRRSYDLASGYQLDAPLDLPQVYVRLFATVLENQQPGFESWLYSPGADPTGRRLIKRNPAVLAHFFPAKGRRPPAMELYTADGSPLPQLIVRRGLGLPLRSTEGQEVARHSGGQPTWMLLLSAAATWPPGTWLAVFSSADGLLWQSERCAVQLGRRG